MRRKKTTSSCSASITVMAALTVMIIMSLLFSIVELARVNALSSVATISKDRAVDSAFSEYNKLLWDEYGVLFFDGGYGTSNFAISNFSDRVDEYAVEKTGMNEVLYISRALTQVAAYTLATDNGGRDFIGQACDRLWISAAVSSLGGIQSDMHTSKKVSEEQSGSEEKFYSALSKMNEAEEERDRKVREAKEAAKRAKEKGEEPPEIPEVKESEEVKEFKSAARQIGTQMKGGIIGLVLGNEASVSSKTMKSTSPVSTRSLNQGHGATVNPKSEYSGAFEDVLFAEYLKEFFSCYCKVKNTHGMSYELEYILCGKKSDRENLEATIKKLLGLRLAENVASIFMDGGLHGTASGLGSELATALWVPPLAPVFTILVMVAWAFVESILDIRTLLDGGKIPLIKNYSTWSSDLHSIAKCLDSNTKAKETSAGITYQGYLNQLIFFQSSQTKAYRAMDMMEESLMISMLTPNARMDNMISRASGTTTLYAEPLFLSLVSLATTEVGEYGFSREFAFTYY